MEVSFEQARELLRLHLLSEGDNSSYIADWGFGNVQWWDVPCGRVELLVECNQEFLEVGAPAWFVNKLTGEVRAGSAGFNPDFFFSDELGGMEPYGDVPAMFLQNFNPEDVDDS